MKWSIFFCIIYFPLHMMSQGDRSEVIVFRNTGMLKSAVPCWVEIGENEKERLGNKTILIVDVSAAGRLKMKVSLEKHGREYVFRVP
ncbi:MAG TPA: hypothetical protein ENJ82_09215, partial [Bacteroidetes bacterium]|nr:hypothetical protein [Bacteroidota bacterium]